MGFKEILSRIGSKSKERKKALSQLQDQIRLQKIAEDRMKSSNERELERFMNEEREEQIKEQLDFMRKKRQKDIRFNHNPLNVRNITNRTDWEVLKEKNMFSKNKPTIFKEDGSVLKNNPNLLNNNKRLIGF